MTPLSYLAAVFCGEREVWRDGVQVPAAQALAEAGITPLRLRPEGRTGHHEWHRCHDSIGLHGLLARRVLDAVDHPYYGDGFFLRWMAMPIISMKSCFP